MFQIYYFIYLFIYLIRFPSGLFFSRERFLDRLAYSFTCIFLLNSEIIYKQVLNKINSHKKY